MRIVFTAGGSGGHFYPIIAVAEEIRRIASEKKLVDAKLYYLATEKYNERALFEQDIEFVPVSAGKLRRYFSWKNFGDVLKTGWGIIRATATLFRIYPDVVLGKGGYVSFPVLIAAKILRIPIVIHESDTVPGRTNQIVGKFADRIAVSYPDTAAYFDAKKVAYVGNPVRHELMHPDPAGADAYLKLEEGVPVILVLGGSQGAEKINEAILRVLPLLVEKYQVIHQTGKTHIDDIQARVGVILEKSEHAGRYRPFPYLNKDALRMSAAKANLVISRAGSTIFEIAHWGVPSIIIPITDSNGDHQRRNAFAYARAGAGLVIEEKNLSPQIVMTEIDRILTNKDMQRDMRDKAFAFARPDAAEKIAQELIRIGLEHER